MPPGFRFPNQQRLWVPLTPLVANDARDFRNLFASGRLKPGVTMQQARQNLDATFAQWEQYPKTHEGWTSRLETLREAFLPPEVPVVLTIMMAGVTLVLFIACSNVANLLLARATARRREIAVRAALGAGRGRIIRQLLTESVLLGSPGLPLGLLLAVVGTRMIAADMPPDQVPYDIHWKSTARSVGLRCVGRGRAPRCCSGCFRRCRSTRGDLHERLKEGTRGNSARRSLLRSALVVVQVALALVALVGALLFVRTFAQLERLQLRLRRQAADDDALLHARATYDAQDAKLRRVQTSSHASRRCRACRRRSPPTSCRSRRRRRRRGRHRGPARRSTDRRRKSHSSASRRTISKTLGVPLTRGRDFTELKASRTTVAVINETHGEEVLGGRDPLGARFRMDLAGERRPRLVHR